MSSLKRKGTELSESAWFQGGGKERERERESKGRGKSKEVEVASRERRRVVVEQTHFVNDRHVPGGRRSD